MVPGGPVAVVLAPAYDRAMKEPQELRIGRSEPEGSPPGPGDGSVRPERVAVFAVGCKANREEMECLQSRLADCGYQVVPFGSAADWIVVNTCTVTSAGDADSRQMIRRAVRDSGRGRVIVTGCLAQRSPESVAAMPGVTQVVGNAEKAGLPDWIRERSRARPAGQADSRDAPAAMETSESTVTGVATFGEASSSDPRSAGASREADIAVSADPTIRAFPGHGTSREGSRERPALKVQDGCDACCTYCVIPSVRGASRSRPLEDCRTQARRLVGSGRREIVLTGINLSLWGGDLPGRPELPDLVEALAGVEGVARLRLSSIEPEALTSAWLERFLGCRSLCRHFHLPLQSGDAEVLRRMGRTYGPELFARRVEAIRRSAPEAAIGTDLLVGFPGESDEAFRRTERLLSDLPLSYLHVFSYSPRPGTASLRLGPVPPQDVVRARSRRLRELSRTLLDRFRCDQMGSEVEVLAERRTGAGLWQGTTGNYLRVRFPWAGSDPRKRGPIPVRLRGVGAEGLLEGERLSSEKPAEAVPGAPAVFGAPA